MFLFLNQGFNDLEEELKPATFLQFSPSFILCLYLHGYMCHACHAYVSAGDRGCLWESIISFHVHSRG